MCQSGALLQVAGPLQHHPLQLLLLMPKHQCCQQRHHHHQQQTRRQVQGMAGVFQAAGLLVQLLVMVQEA